ncbi:hypothetical protein OF83DRAFT_1290761 [Amylostereum chailletii]|nr:hypothetical protein OF83DRAFT_1290761 [Amylostereum chailletii]
MHSIPAPLLLSSSTDGHDNAIQLLPFRLAKLSISARLHILGFLSGSQRDVPNVGEHTRLPLISGPWTGKHLRRRIGLTSRGFNLRSTPIDERYRGRGRRLGWTVMWTGCLKSTRFWIPQEDDGVGGTVFNSEVIQSDDDHWAPVHLRSWTLVHVFCASAAQARPPRSTLPPPFRQSPGVNDVGGCITNKNEATRTSAGAFLFSGRQPVQPTIVRRPRGSRSFFGRGRGACEIGPLKARLVPRALLVVALYYSPFYESWHSTLNLRLRMHEDEVPRPPSVDSETRILVPIPRGVGRTSLRCSPWKASRGLPTSRPWDSLSMLSSSMEQYDPVGDVGHWCRLTWGRNQNRVLFTLFHVKQVVTHHVCNQGSSGTDAPILASGITHSCRRHRYSSRRRSELDPRKSYALNFPPSSVDRHTSLCAIVFKSYTRPSGDGLVIYLLKKDRLTARGTGGAR